MTTTLDSRLRHAGLHLSAELLLDLWTDHRPHDLPVPATCPTCHHHYTANQPFCPTAAAIRPLLRQRRHEIGLVAIDQRLTHLQRHDLLTNQHPSTTPADHTEPVGATTPTTPALF